jgi:ABC-type phosphate/phosphonate transport system substrate-binding protein
MSNRTIRILSRLQPRTHRILPVLVMFMILVVPPVFDRQAALTAEITHIVVAYSANTFLDESSDRSQTVIQAWNNTIAKKWGGTADSKIYNNLAEIEQAVRAQQIDMVVLLPVEYLELKNRIPLEPLFVSAKSDGIYDTLVLVVRQDSGIQAVKDLKGKSLLNQKGLYAANRNMWIDILLMRNGVRDLDRFFSSVKEVNKPSKALLPVLFRQADACVVTRSSLQMMSELNPQLWQNLKVIEEAVPQLSSVIALRKGLPAKARNDLKEILGNLDHNIQGQQLLALFRVSKLVEFRPEYLTSQENFVREHRNLKMQISKRAQ